MPRNLEKRQLVVVIACIVDAPTSEFQRDGSVQLAYEPKVLLARRKEAEQREIHLMWELPGGKIDPGETPEQAVIREVYEETGYRVTVVKKIPFSYTTEWQYDDYLLHTVVDCYECSVSKSPEGSLPKDAKIDEVQWFTFDNIDFSRVLPGSREFIWYIAKRYAIDLTQYQPQIAYAQFTLLEPDKNQHKFYLIVLQIAPNAESPYFVTTRHGRIAYKGAGHREIKTFPSDKEAREEILKRLRLRRRHRYVLTECSDNFPFKVFLDSFPRPEDATQKQLRLQNFPEHTPNTSVPYLVLIEDGNQKNENTPPIKQLSFGWKV